MIIFDGIDGGGKTTHIKLVCAWLNEIKIDYILTREPGGTKIAESIREIFLNNKLNSITQLLLISAARYEHTKMLKEKKSLILCDRYIDSTYAYQGGELTTDLIDFFVNLTMLKKPTFVFLFLSIYKKKEENDMDEFFFKNQFEVIERFKERARINPNLYMIIPNVDKQQQHEIIKRKISEIMKI